MVRALIKPPVANFPWRKLAVGIKIVAVSVVEDVVGVTIEKGESLVPGGLRHKVEVQVHV